MRDFLRLLIGDGERAEQGADGWDEPRRRASIADSRDWCGSGPDGDAIRQAAERLRGRGRPGRRGAARVVVRGGRRAGPFGI